MVVGGWSVAQLSHLSRIYFHRGRRFNHFLAPCLKKDGSLLNHPYLELTNYCVSYCVCEHVVSLGLSLCANVLQFCCVLGVYVKTRLCWGDVRPFLYHFVCLSVLLLDWLGWVWLPLDHSSRRKKKFPTSDMMLRWTRSGLDTLVEVLNTITGILNYLCILLWSSAIFVQSRSIISPQQNMKAAIKRWNISFPNGHCSCYV